MRRHVLALGLAVTAACLPASNAWATAYDEVFGDWQKDGRITPCQFSVATLDEALTQVPGDTDTYTPEFREDVTAERRRVGSGRCGTGAGAAALLRIRSVRARGSLGEECVTVTNRGQAKVRLAGWEISNQAGRRYRFTHGALRALRSVKVCSGSGTDGRGTFFWRSAAQVWPDRGGLATLWAPGRRRVQRLRYGSFG